MMTTPPPGYPVHPIVPSTDIESYMRVQQCLRSKIPDIVHESQAGAGLANLYHQGMSVLGRPKDDGRPITFVYPDVNANEQSVQARKVS